MNEPNRAVQEEELEALRAIFEDDWNDIPPKKTAWGQQESGWWEVTLRAEDDERVAVKLKGRMTKTYPDQAPPILLAEPSNLSPAHLSTLTRLLETKAKASVGAPMIFDLADFVREWITSNHMPLTRPGEVVPTLMEEMAQREEAQRAAEAAQYQADKEQRRAAAEEQNRLLQEKIQLDALRKEERARLAAAEETAARRQESLASLADGELEVRELALDAPITVDGCDGAVGALSLFGGRRESLWTAYVAEPVVDGVSNPGFVKATLPSLGALVVDFAHKYYSTLHGRKRVDALAAEVGRLELVDSANVQKVYAIKREKSPKGFERLVVVVERAPEGGKLRGWLPKQGLGEETAREYLTQVLCGLADMHRRNVTQKHLVMLQPRAAGELCVQLTGSSYARRIIEYHRSNPFLKSLDDPCPESWLSPDEIDAPYSYSAKRDVWHTGLLLLQMLYGAQCIWTYPDLHTLLQHGVSESMMEILSGLLNPSAKKRFTAEDALAKLRAEDDVTRRPSKQTSLSNHSSTSISQTSPMDLFGRSPVFGRGLAAYFPQTPQANMARTSRYRSDFEEVEFLGKGGFGEVVKARNRLDGRSYAIKKVKLRPEDNEQKVFREVNSLSRVSHQHIVRYYGCWLEEVGPPERADSVDSAPSVPTTASSADVPPEAVDDEDIFAVNFDELNLSRRDHSRSASFPRIRFANSDSDDEDEDDEEEDSSSARRNRVGPSVPRLAAADSDDSADSDASTDSDSDAETAADPSEQHAARASARPRAARPLAIPVKHSASVTGTTTDDGAVQRILYIQMEFVEKMMGGPGMTNEQQTLREAIGSGLEEDETWRLLVQILQALAHMASLGIVHRDLKPSNILLDANGNVKIADFGLSTTDIAAVETGEGLHSSADFSDRTSNIGTSLYIAPEVLISRSYNEKADMYSLGIIFFEMCFPFKTGMERAHTLNALRTPKIVFPAAWPVGHLPKQREIVESLLKHEPSGRPSATQLLTSPLVPSPEKQKEFYDNAIAELTNPRSSQYPALVDALFDSGARAHVDTRQDDYTYDNEHDDELHIWTTVVADHLVALFRRHGAVDDHLPLLVPETTLLNAFPDLRPVRLLDQLGTVVQLPSSDLLALARSASRRRIERIKRYHVGRKYAAHPGGGQPIVAGELSFDIVSPVRSMVAEAELLEVIDKAISECQGARGSASGDYEFHVSHESVLATILASAPDRVRPQVLKAFKDLGTGVGSGHVRARLANVPGLSRPLLDDLEQCTMMDEFGVVRRKLEAVFSGSRRKLAQAMDEVAVILQLARACGVSRRIMFRPTLSRNAEFFRGGFMFEIVRRGKQKEVVAFGGRYDSLLEHFKEPAINVQPRKAYGVGMSIAVDQLARMVRKYESALSERLMTKDAEDERSFGFWSPARCDVYVAANSQVDLAARMGVAGDLWKAGIRADLQYDDGRALEEVTFECIEQNVLFLVIPRANRPTVKLRNVLKRSEEEVARNDLAAHLRAAIAEQRRVDATYASSAEGASASLLAAAAAADAAKLPGGGGAAAQLSIKLVLPPEPINFKPGQKRPVRKFRHVTKSVYYDKASEFLASVRSALPLIAVDLAPALLAQLALDPAWVAEDEPWRAVLAGLPSQERAYVEHVREAAAEVRGSCWLFALREARLK